MISIILRLSIDTLAVAWLFDSVIPRIGKWHNPISSKNGDTMIKLYFDKKDVVAIFICYAWLLNFDKSLARYYSLLGIWYIVILTFLFLLNLALPSGNYVRPQVIRTSDIFINPTFIAIFNFFMMFIFIVLNT